MYKDKDKQREANRQAQARFKAKKVLLEQGITGGGITEVINDIGVRDEVLEDEGLKPKRGKDIKTFEDLPPDVQATINRISESNEEKAKRTAVAIKYQYLFLPDNTHKGFINKLYSPEHIEHCRKVERWDKKAVADGRGGPL